MIRIIALLALLCTNLAAVEGVALERGDRDDLDIEQPDYRDEAAAKVAAEGLGSALVYVFNTGLDAKDGFWTIEAVAASESVPVVSVPGGLESAAAKAWGLRELPAVVAADWYGNRWAQLEGKAVKPAAVEALMQQAQGLVGRTREQIAEAIAKAVELSVQERKLPASIATLNRFAGLKGLPEAKQAQDALDAIVVRGLGELQDLARQMDTDPAAAKRALAKFIRVYDGTPLKAQAEQVKDGQPIDMAAPTPAVPAAGEQSAAEPDAVDIFGGQ